MKTIKKPIKKAQNGTVKYSDPTVEFEKIKKTKDSIYKANFDLKNKKREQELKPILYLTWETPHLHALVDIFQTTP